MMRRLLRVFLFLGSIATVALYLSSWVNVWLTSRSVRQHVPAPTTSSSPCRNSSTDTRRGTSPCPLTSSTVSARKTPNTGKRQVVVLTYGRSGSSLTGHLMAQDPSTFYIFEPLQKLLRRYTKRGKFKSYDIIDSQPRYPAEPTIQGNLTYSNFSTEARAILRHFLSCQFQYLTVHDLTTPIFLFRELRLRQRALMTRCMRSTGHNAAYYLDCLRKQREDCLSKDVQIAKVIRLPAKLLPPLMEDLPRLKVVYLVRDPRGTLLSELTVLNFFNHLGLHEAARSFCSMMADDVLAIRQLSTVYPDRIKVLRFETLATDPVETTRRLYNYLELNFTSDIEAHVHDVTSSSMTSHSFSVRRPDAWQAANKWRSIIGYHDAAGVDNTCGDVYEALGYRKVANEEELRDTGVALFTKSFGMENV